MQYPRGGRSSRRRRDRHGGRDLCREPRLRQPLRPVPGRRRHPGGEPERGRRVPAAGRSRRLAARDPAADLGRPHRGAPGDQRAAGRDHRPAEPSVPGRRRQRAGRQGHRRSGRRRDARPGAPLLQQHHADRRRPQRRLRRLVRRRRPDDGLLRRQPPRDVAGRAPLHARRPFLHGRVRRLVPEPSVPRVRLHPRVPERRRADLAGARLDLGDRERCPGELRAHGPGRRRGEQRARRAAALSPRRHADAEGCRRHLPRRQHDAAAVPAERHRARAGRRSALRRSGGGDDAASADAGDDRRPPRREGRLVGLVQRCLEGGERRHAGGARHHLQGPGPVPAASPAVQLLRQLSIRRRTAPIARRT